MNDALVEGLALLGVTPLLALWARRRLAKDGARRWLYASVSIRVATEGFISSAQAARKLAEIMGQLAETNRSAAEAMKGARYGR